MSSGNEVSFWIAFPAMMVMICVVAMIVVFLWRIRRKRNESTANGMDQSAQNQEHQAQQAESVQIEPGMHRPEITDSMHSKPSASSHHSRGEGMVSGNENATASPVVTPHSEEECDC